MKIHTSAPGPKPKAIIFDLSEVYLSGLKGTHESLGRHLDLTLEGEVFDSKELTNLFHGKITEAEYWRHTIDHNGWDVTIAEAERIVRENFVPIDGTEEIVKDLKRAKYRLGLLSVHAKEWIEYCEQKFHYRELFDVVMYSFEHGVSKPDIHAYKLILNALKLSPKESVFVDDSEANIKAAREIGMTAIQFTTAEHLKRELSRLGIL